ncbi:MAG TPA: hypothetical protein PKI03_23110 [Pseudomonadota bacterium]|nr:hypothetical protein [Pseudomonadota bacterium]
MKSPSTHVVAVSDLDDELLVALRGAEAEQLDEEASPNDPQTAERAVLYVQIVDADHLDQGPAAGIDVEVSGAGLSETRHLVTDAQGEILIEDCGPGVYTLSRGSRQAQAHTLSSDDLSVDGSAFRVLL